MWVSSGPQLIQVKVTVPLPGLLVVRTTKRTALLCLSVVSNQLPFSLLILPASCSASLHVAERVGSRGKEKGKEVSDTENRPVMARGRGGGRGVREMGKGGQKVQASTYKINKLWEGNGQHDDYS